MINGPVKFPHALLPKKEAIIREGYVILGKHQVSVIFLDDLAARPLVSLIILFISLSVYSIFCEVKYGSDIIIVSTS